MRRREAVTRSLASSEAERSWSEVIKRAFTGEVRYRVQKREIRMGEIDRRERPGVLVECGA